MEFGTKALQPSFESWSDLLTSPNIITIYFELRKALDLRYAFFQSRNWFVCRV